MTNEQLAILLQSYEAKLSDILSGLTYDLEHTELMREKSHYYQWIGEGKEPYFDMFVNKSISPDYQKVETDGKFICLSPLENFINDLQSSIDVLKGNNEREDKEMNLS